MSLSYPFLVKQCEKLGQILVKLKYRLQGVRKIKKDVDIKSDGARRGGGVGRGVWVGGGGGGGVGVVVGGRVGGGMRGGFRWGRGGRFCFHIRIHPKI